MQYKLAVGLILFLGVVTLTGAGCANNQTSDPAMMEKEKAMMEKEEAMMAEKEAMMEKEKMMVAKGSYTDYDPAKLANAEKGNVILFFHAKWCPTCIASNKNFLASATPDGLTLLKVDYDNSTELKRKYGVTYQHTFVKVDKNGNLIKKWSGSSTYDELGAQLK